MHRQAVCCLVCSLRMRVFESVGVDGEQVQEIVGFANCEGARPIKKWLTRDWRALAIERFAGMAFPPGPVPVRMITASRRDQSASGQILGQSDAFILSRHPRG